VSFLSIQHKILFYTKIFTEKNDDFLM